MSRIRTVKPEFFTSEQVMECSPSARLLFIGMWCFCDDQGVHPASIKTLKAEVFPADEITIAEVDAMVDELVGNGLLVSYHSGGKPYWFVTGWHHQRVDKPTRKHPPPPDFSDSNPEELPDNSNSPPGVLDERSTTEGKGVESKGVNPTQAKACESPPAENPPAGTVCPPCPIEEIVALYHELLPELPKFLVRNDTRDGYIRSRWREFYAAGDFKTKPEGLACFRFLFFEKVKPSRFLTGRAEPGRGHKPFTADLEWLMRPTNFAKVIEGKYA